MDKTLACIDGAISRLRRCVILADEKMQQAIQCNSAPLIKHMEEMLKISSDNSEPRQEVEKLIEVESFRDETQMPDIMKLITKDLSEPYSIYTYRYFIHNWPNLCLLAHDRKSGHYVGVIVCKVEKDAKGYCRGYIAMLAVDKSYRRAGIGTRLVGSAIEIMSQLGCNEIALETEVTNSDAKNLYSRLGFIREKRLFRYYLNGVDAFRLKLLLSEPPADIASSLIAGGDC